MPIIGAPLGQIHSNQQQQHSFNSYDHQRVGSFRSRLKKQHPIRGSENNEAASTNLFVPVDVERINQPDVSASMASQYYTGMTRSASPTNEQKTSCKPDNTKEILNCGTTDPTPAGKNMMVSLTSSNTGNNAQVQSFVVVEGNGTSVHDSSNVTAKSNNTNTAFEHNLQHGISKKPRSQKRFWGIGGSGSSSRSGGSLKSNSFHSSRSSNANSSKESKDLDCVGSKDSANASKYLSVTYKSQD